MATPTISSTPSPSAFVDAKADTVSPLVDYETGGVALQDPSEGLQYQVWTARTDGTDITIEADNSPAQVIYSGTNITEISLAFDSNMNYFVAFVEDGQAKFKWYDSTVSDFTVTDLGATDANPRCTLDDKRSFNNSGRSIILAYLRGDNLYARYQNDRYDTEYNLGAITPGKKLAKIGMGSGLRLNYLLSDTLSISSPEGEVFTANEKLAFSFFLQPKFDFGTTRVVGFGSNESAIAVDYDSDGLYVTLPGNQATVAITNTDGFVEDVKAFVAVSVYLSDDDRPGKGFKKVTNVDIIFVDTGACGAVVKKSQSFYQEDLGGTHAFGSFAYGSGIFIGGKGKVNHTTSFMLDALWVRDYAWTEAEADQYLEDLGICVPPPPEPETFTAEAENGGGVFIIQRSGGNPSVSTASRFVTMSGGSGNYQVTYTANPASEFSQMTLSPGVTNPGDGLEPFPIVISGASLVDNGDGTKTAKAWSAGYSPASGYDVEPGGTATKTIKIDWEAKDLTSGDTVTGTFEATLTIQDMSQPMQ